MTMMYGFYNYLNKAFEFQSILNERVKIIALYSVFNVGHHNIVLFILCF